MLGYKWKLSALKKYKGQNNLIEKLPVHQGGKSLLTGNQEEDKGTMAAGKGETGTNFAAGGGRGQMQYSHERYDWWVSRTQKKGFEALTLGRWAKKFRQKPSVAVVIYCQAIIEESFFWETMLTVLRQSYDHWKAYLLVSGEAADQLDGYIKNLSAWDKSKIAFAADKRTSRLLNALTEDYVVFCSMGDILQPHALFEMVYQLNVLPGCRLVYADHDYIDRSGRRYNPFFKPDWSPDLLLSTNYFGRFCMVSREYALKVGGVNDDLEEAKYYDLWLRITEKSGLAAHVADILCSYRENETDIKTYSVEIMVLSQSMLRRGISASVFITGAPGKYRVKRTIAEHPRVSIIILATGRLEVIGRCLTAVEKNTSYSNYEVIIVYSGTEENEEVRRYLSGLKHRVLEVNEPYNRARLNNLGAKEATGDCLVFLNADTEVIVSDWLEAMLEHALRPEVAMVSPLLLYPDSTVQYAGLVLTPEGNGCLSIFRRQPWPGNEYQDYLKIVRNCTVVTGACVMIRKGLFLEAGCFDEGFNVVHSDTDFCLRTRKMGYLHVWTPFARLYRHEAACHGDVFSEDDQILLRSRWSEAFHNGDPYHNPNLSLDSAINITDNLLAIDNKTNFYFEAGEVRRILVISLDHRGDQMLCLPAIRKLRRKFPGAEITLLGAGWSREIYAHEPVDRVLVYDYFSSQSLLMHKDFNNDEEKARVRSWLSGYNFDLAVDLRKLPDTYIFLKDLSRARFLVGSFLNPPEADLDIAVLPQVDAAGRLPKNHAAEKKLQLIEAIHTLEDVSGAMVLSGDELARIKIKFDAVLTEKTGFVVGIHPGVGDYRRQWPGHYFGILADWLIDRGATVVFFGGADDLEIIRSVGESMKGRAYSLAGQINIREFMGMVSCCHLFIGNNSGPMHMAAQMGVPTVGIFSGLVDAREWGPLGGHALTVGKVSPCSPCYIGDCKEGCSMDCKKTLYPGDVIKAIKRIAVLTGFNWPEISGEHLT